MPESQIVFFKVFTTALLSAPDTTSADAASGTSAARFLRGHLSAAHIERGVSLGAPCAHYGAWARVALPAAM